MSEKRLFNIIELSYAPLSNYDFVMVREDPHIQHYINSGKIYVIAQRPVLTFENFWMDDSTPEDLILKFEIHQKGKDQKLTCEFPLFQDELDVPYNSQVQLGLTYTFPKSEQKQDIKMPFNSLANFIIKTANDLVVWLSPEKLIYHHLRGALQARIIGDIADFLEYKVHYIGKATEQDVIKRLTGHSHLQDVLSVERPFHYGSLPTDEIAILFFAFQENLFIDTYGPDDPVDDAVRILMGESLVDQDTIYLDAEKALIQALKPVHNKLLYKNYPKSTDGLHPHNLDLYTFSFADPVTLIYPNGEIKGSQDYILVKKGEPLMIKHRGDE